MFTEARAELCGVDLDFAFPDGLPDAVDPQDGTSVRVVVGPDSAIPQPGTGMFHLGVDGGPFVSLPMVQGEPNDYTATVPPLDCGSVADFYFSADTTDGETVTSPRFAPTRVFSAIAAGQLASSFDDDFETDQGWTVTDAGGLTDGQWQRGHPIPNTVCDRGNPGDDADGSGQCFVTDNDPGACDSDVDNGSTILTSPVMDASQGEPVVGYWRWFSTTAGDSPFQDVFVVEVSGDGGSSWIELETVGPTGREAEGGWFRKNFRVGGFIDASGLLRIRFVASDTDPQSVVEAGVDGVNVIAALCDGPGGCPWDLDGDGTVGITDLLDLLGQWGADPGGPPDFDGDGAVGINDFLELLANWGACP
jgi:hypothetical protein